MEGQSAGGLYSPSCSGSGVPCIPYFIQSGPIPLSGLLFSALKLEYPAPAYQDLVDLYYLHPYFLQSPVLLAQSPEGLHEWLNFADARELILLAMYVHSPYSRS